MGSIFLTGPGCLTASRLDHAKIPVGQFLNAVRLTVADRILRDEVLADTQGDRSRANKVPGVLLVHTSRSNQRYMLEGSA